MNSTEDSTEGSFDIDVVGLTDLNEFKSEGELFDFDSTGDYGLFGGKDFYHFGSSNKTLVNAEKIKSKIVLSCRKKRRNKDWNETEKDLFLKGLEMFGENWRKISKFIATKTPYQVKIYYQLWSETANVIHDTEPFTNDSSIYLPIISEENNICLSLTQDGNDVDFVNAKYIASTSNINTPLSVVRSYALMPPEAADEVIESRSIEKENCGDELFVSSLHDWSLGSQVSVIEDMSSFNSQEQSCFENDTHLLEDSSVYPRKCTFKSVSNNKNKNNSKLFKKQRKVVGFKKQNRKMLSMEEKISGGQVIHISKGNDIDSDVDIIGSDDEERGNNFEECHFNIDCSDDKAHEYTTLSEAKFNNVEFFLKSLTTNERDFCEKRLGLDKIHIFNYAKKYILKIWNERKFLSHISLSQILHGYDHPNINRKDVSKIFYFLVKQGLINYNAEEESVQTKENSQHIEQMKKKMRSKTCGHLSGGVTMSHDASGLVIDAVHVPENHSKRQSPCKKSKIVSSGTKLQNCLKYEHGRNAPFSIIIHPAALILFDIHAHSSFSEVMGLLGGFLDKNNCILYITTVVPTKAISSAIDCEMCPFDQKNALQTIVDKGVEVVGWYHSHPTFLPNPSKRDIETQAQLQEYFQRQNSPFIGLIVSPFCTSVFSGASLIRCIILDEQTVGSHGTVSPFCLPWRVNDKFDIEYDDIESSVIKLFVKIDSHPESVEWSKEYINGISFANKLCQSLLTHIPINLKNTINLVKNTLCCKL